MAGADNLKGHGFECRSADEVREAARKGGIKSGESRRRKKAMKTVLRELLTQPAQGKAKQKAQEIGAAPDDIDNQAAILAAMINKAQSGNVMAARYISELIGEDPTVELKRKEIKIKQDELKLKQQEAERAAAEEQTSLEADLAAIYAHRIEQDNDAGEPNKANAPPGGA